MCALYASTKYQEHKLSQSLKWFCGKKSECWITGHYFLFQLPCFNNSSGSVQAMKARSEKAFSKDPTKSKVFWLTRPLLNHYTTDQVPHEPDRRSASLSGWCHGGTISQFPHHQVRVIRRSFFDAQLFQALWQLPVLHQWNTLKVANGVRLQQHFLHWMVQCADCDKLSTPVLTLTPTWRELCPRMLPSCLSKDNGGALKQEQRWWFSTAFLLPMISNRTFTKLCFQFLKSSHPYLLLDYERYCSASLSNYYLMP